MLEFLAPILNLATTAIDRAIPDASIAANAKAEMMKMVATGELQKQIAESDYYKRGQEIILAEANSSSWLTKNWRPMTMIIFVGLLTAHWFGWSSPTLRPEEYLAFFDLVKLGLGGYVIGRTVEKTAGPVVASVVGALKK